jgi:transcriptional regulator with XRE-family HTH domain
LSEEHLTSAFPQRLRESREKLGIAQQELARLCSFGLNQINRYERGVQEPSVPALIKIANILGVSLDYLVGMTDDSQGQTTSSDLNVYEREILETFRHEGWVGVGKLSLDKLAK